MCKRSFLQKWWVLGSWLWLFTGGAVSAADGVAVDGAAVRVVVATGGPEDTLSVAFSGMDSADIALVSVIEQGCNGAIAERLAALHGASAVVCRSDTDTVRRLYCFVPSATGTSVASRTFDRDSPSSMTVVQTEIVRGWMATLLRDKGSATELPSTDASFPDGVSSPPASKSGEHFAAEIGYTLGVQSEHHPVVHGASFSVGWRFSRWADLLFSYLYTASTVDVVSTSRLELRSHPIWVGTRLFFPMGRVELGGAFFLVLNYVSLDVTAPETLVTTGDSGYFQVALSPMLTGAVKLAGPLRAYLMLGADFRLNKMDYLVGGADGNVFIHTEWPVQPRVIAGLSLVLF